MSNIKNVAMITVCGRPNVGKSSLTNALVGEKVAIVSNKAQTTRNRIYGVVNREDTQYILLDTPGLHKPKSALGDYMVKVVTSSLSDVDCALLLVEPIPHVGGPEQALIDRIREEEIPCILCVNKIDTVEPAELLPVIAAYNQAWDGFDAIIPISAHTGSGLKDLMKELRKYAQEGPQLFPDGMTTDQPERQVMGEILREKLLLCLEKLGASGRPIPAPAGWAWTFLMVNFGWVLFRAPSLPAALDYLGAMFSPVRGADLQACYYWEQYAAVILPSILFSFPLGRWLTEKVEVYLGRYAPHVFSLWDMVYGVSLLFLLLASSAFLVKGTYNPFIYFNF